MTERERWIVYPLLFLALGAGLRDKLIDRTISKSIYCQALVVVDEEPVGQEPVRVLARIGRSEPISGAPTSGELLVNGNITVNGRVNANSFAFQGVPIVPAFQPGVSLGELLRGLQQSIGDGRGLITTRPEQPSTGAAGSAGGPDDADQTDNDPRQRPAGDQQPQSEEMPGSQSPDRGV